jgi:hypothetical protein
MIAKAVAIAGVKQRAKAAALEAVIRAAMGPAPEAVRQLVLMAAAATAKVLKALKNIVFEEGTFAAICRQTRAGKFRPL